MIDAQNLFNLLEEGHFTMFRKAADLSPVTRVACDQDGDFLLHRAVERGSLAACRYLLKRGIPADCPGDRGTTPLHYAAAGGNCAIMRELLQAAGPHHSPIVYNGMTPLHVAAGEGRLAIVKMLVSKGADISARERFGRLPLHFAAGANQLQVVRWMVAQEPGLIDEADAFGQRPIHWALQFESVRTAIWLIRHGVDLKTPDIYSRSPLRICGLGNDADPLRLLGPVRLGMVLRGTMVRRLTPLQRAVFCENIEEVKKLLRKPADLNRRGALGRTALHTAALARNRAIYRWMRGRGADTGIVDDYGWTPFRLLSYCLIKERSARCPARQRDRKHDSATPPHFPGKSPKHVRA